MAKKVVTKGTVHDAPSDLKKALVSDVAALAKWEDITPLARNECLLYKLWMGDYCK